ncbi:MAG: hypothetical protein M3R25_05850 [Bacteroidota bacterium]|nr:hypothetical protein [Bacteroidota bacterium]
MNTKTLSKKLIFSLLMAGVMIGFNANAQVMASSDQTLSKTAATTENTVDIANWPKASQMAVEEMTNKYGKPDMVGEEVVAWMNKGNWKTIHVSKKESKHSFPIEHTDMMEQCISYKVPVGKMDDLGKFDGSITFDRTQGLMCARCDMEANNLLALNLANDIVTGKASVKTARRMYADIVKEKMNGGTPMYMQKLTFTAHSSPADPDLNTTGLSKDDMKKSVTKNTIQNSEMKKEVMKKSKS